MSRSYTNAKRIEWIDGVKGIACILILLHHYLLAFYPAAILGDGQWLHTQSGVEDKYVHSVFSVLTNGNYLVCIFLMLSGIVLTLQVVNAKKDTTVVVSMIKRYFRLALPLFVVCTAVCVLLYLGLFRNVDIMGISGSAWLASDYLEVLPFTEVLRNSFFSILFKGDTTFSNAFWMLDDLFLGSYIAFVVAFILRKNRLVGNVVNVLTIGLLWYFKVYFMICFPLGIILYQLVMKVRGMSSRLIQIIVNIVGLILLVFGIYLGSYPSHVGPTGFLGAVGYQTQLRLGVANDDVKIIVHITAAFITLLGLALCTMVQDVFETKVPKHLGKISFGVYLLHVPVIMSAGCIAAQWTFRGTGEYTISAFIAFVVSVFVTLLLAIGFTKYIEGGIQKILSKLG